MNLRAMSSIAGLACFVGLAVAAQPKPKAPAGQDPGGVAVAVLGGGIDYTEAAIAARLARDGEGEPIGLDLATGDNRPFAVDAAAPGSWGAGDQALARALAASRGIRLVAVKLDRPVARQIAQAIAFVAATPARQMMLPVWADMQDVAKLLDEAARRYPNVAFLVPMRRVAGDTSDGRRTSAGNVVTVATTADAGADLVVPPPLPVTGAGETTPAGLIAALVDRLRTCSRKEVARMLADAPKLRVFESVLAAIPAGEPAIVGSCGVDVRGD